LLINTAGRHRARFILQLASHNHHFTSLAPIALRNSRVVTKVACQGKPYPSIRGSLPEASLQQLTDLFAGKIFILDIEDRNIKLPLYAHDAPLMPDAAAQW
jgi:hypothetical protein